MGWKGEERPSRSFVFVRKMDMETKKGTKNEVIDGKPPKVGKMRGERDSEGSDEEMSDDDVGSWSDDDVEGMDDEQEPEDEVSS